MIEILPSSVQSLLLRLYFNETFLSSATGFIVKENNNYFLVTNRHVFTGKHQKTDQTLSKTGGIPNYVEVFYNKKNELGVWQPTRHPIYENINNLNGRLWLEHPKLGAKADVVLLPISLKDEFEFYPYNLNDEIKISVKPTEVISVIGFPFGLTGGGCLGLWATGFIASEPQINFDDLPTFLIDCRSRQGQSGSPVVAPRNGGTVTMENGSSAIFSQPITKFLGVYSGRINEESDLGVVWKPQVIQDILEDPK